LDKYYDYFLIDEVQDFAGHDFNLLLNILPERCETICVGDFFQHTYDTSLDGNVRKSLYNNLRQYIKEWQKAGVVVETITLSKTRRCSQEICDFVCQMGIAIESTGEAKGSVFYVEDEAKCEEIINTPSIPKLFLMEGNKYFCAGMNWGASKGLDHFVDVCVVLNKSSVDLYLKGKLSELNPKTKNKLYVACTRAHRHLFIMSYKRLEKYRLQ
jgi:DNA helicase-2/ATP-dependent DNA helicase PcrA